MVFLYLSLAVTLESISNMIFKDEKRWKSLISTLSIGFLHNMFSNIKIWFLWCIIDVFQWNSIRTLDLLKSLNFTKILVDWIWLITNEFMCRLLWILDLYTDYDCMVYRLSQIDHMSIVYS